VAWIGSYLLILVGALEHGFYFSIELGMSSSQLTNSMIFQRGGEKPPTSYQWYEIPAPVDFYVFFIFTTAVGNRWVQKGPGASRR